jgi:hypothetical protein
MLTNKKKTAAAPATAKDTSDAILNAMNDTRTTGTPTSSTITTGVDEAFDKAGPASAKLNNQKK